jgi:putative SOS response-associated peptidase YedK
LRRRPWQYGITRLGDAFDNPIDPKRLLVNARDDKVAKSPFFKKALQTMRCLVPADGYYEFRQSDPKGAMRRYVFKAGEAFAFAGLWQERSGSRSYTIITTSPNSVASEIHDRMPVVLAKEDYERWLDPGTKVDDLQALLRPWTGAFSVAEAPKAVKTKTDEVLEDTKKASKAKKGTKSDATGGLFG